MSEYVASIINNYGDADNVRADVKALNDIINRQGNNLLLDVIAEHVGRVSKDFKLSDDDVRRVRRALVEHLTNAINERT